MQPLMLICLIIIIRVVTPKCGEYIRCRLRLQALLPNRVHYTCSGAWPCPLLPPLSCPLLPPLPPPTPPPSISLRTPVPNEPCIPCAVPMGIDRPTRHSLYRPPLFLPRARCSCITATVSPFKQLPALLYAAAVALSPCARCVRYLLAAATLSSPLPTASPGRPLTVATNQPGCQLIRPRHTRSPS